MFGFVTPSRLLTSCIPFLSLPGFLFLVYRCREVGHRTVCAAVRNKALRLRIASVQRFHSRKYAILLWIGLLPDWIVIFQYCIFAFFPRFALRIPIPWYCCFPRALDVVQLRGVGNAFPLLDPANIPSFAISQTFGN